MIPIAEGAVSVNHIQGEIGKVLIGELAGRADPREVTLYKSVGIAAQDLYAAWWVFRKATKAGGVASP
jgi:alanine dehydrogenase